MHSGIDDYSRENIQFLINITAQSWTERPIVWDSNYHNLNMAGNFTDTSFHETGRNLGFKIFHGLIFMVSESGTYVLASSKAKAE